MEKVNLLPFNYENVSKKDVLEVYRYWLEDISIDDNFKYSWEALFHNNKKGFSLERLQEIYIQANAIRLKNEALESLSESQKSFLHHYCTCFPFPKRKLMAYVVEFFTLFDKCYQNTGNNTRELSNIQKIEQAFAWTIEEKISSFDARVTREEIVAAYEAWFQASHFTDSVDWAFQRLSSFSPDFKDYQVGQKNENLQIQKNYALIQEKIMNREELNDFEKELIIDFWICFKNDDSMDKACRFFDLFDKYYRELGLNPYYVSSSEKIRLAKQWQQEEIKKRERMKKQCI